MKELYLTIAFCSAFYTLNAQNLVFHTKFDNGQAQDISGNNLNGVLNGPVACPGVSGQANTALYFDGVNDYVEIPANNALNLTKWTLHATVRPDAFNAQQCQASGIIWHGVQGSDNFMGLYICDNFYDNDCTVDSDMEAFAGLTTGFSAPDFQSSWYDTNGYVTEGQWYCAVLTYDGDSLALYINGDLVEKEQHTDYYNYTNPIALTIGNGTEPGFYYWFKGAMDEISIWDDAVSQTQVTNSICDSFLIATNTTNYTQTDKDIKVYPSPASDVVYVETGDNWNSADWYVLNCLGQIVMEGTITNGRTSLNMNDLSSGLYMLKLTKGSSIDLRKIIKN